jgi:hypothetical protein
MSFAMGKSSSSFILPKRRVEAHILKKSNEKKSSGINTNGIATVSIEDKKGSASLTELMDTLDTIKPNYKASELLINPNIKLSFGGDIRVAVIPCTTFPSKIEVVLESEDASILCTIVDLYTNDIIHSFTSDLDIASFITNVTFTNNENITCPNTVLALDCKLIKTEEGVADDDIGEEINTYVNVLAVKFTM